MPKLVVSVIADERAGLVSEMASVVAESGGNWLESQMTRLAGKFAGVVLVEVPPEQVADLTAALQQLGQAGGVEVLVASAEGAPVPAAESVRLRLIGHDQPGIVRDVGRALAAHGMSIEELHTAISDAPMSGEKLFEAVAVVRLIEDLDLGSVRASLDAVSKDLKLDIELDDGSDAPAWGEVPDDPA